MVKVYWEIVALCGFITFMVLHLFVVREASHSTPSSTVSNGDRNGAGGGSALIAPPSGSVAVAMQKLPPPSSTSTPRTTTAIAAVTVPPSAPRSSGSSSYRPLRQEVMAWRDFASLPLDDSFKYSSSLSSEEGWKMHYKPIVCPAQIATTLASPRLTEKDVKFCQWAVDRQGGGVVVGKSWGRLSSRQEKDRFDVLNCNAVASSGGQNPSCDDSWGDRHIRQWRNQSSQGILCRAERTSKVNCKLNDNKDTFCIMDNVMIDFSKVKKVPRSGSTPSKKFEQNFLSSDCLERHDASMAGQFPFPHLFSTSLSSGKCDVVYNGTLLLFSHDDIRNVGHTMNDIMNVWVSLWLGGIARYSREIDMLNIDSFKLGHNFDDKPNRFFYTYMRNFKTILKGIDFADKTFCAKRLLIQPTPPRFFVWESWFVDLPCSFVGPSSLYQRWNLHVRQSYDLLSKPMISSQKKGVILVIVRNENSNMWGSQRTSRNYLNTDAIQTGLKRLVEKEEYRSDFELVLQDLSKLSFRQQIELMARSSLVIGMHGAGIAMTMHMSIGNPRCCGVLEIYPKGEFSPIRGHGNMVRKMGLHYDRVDIGASDSRENGAVVPVQELVSKTEAMLNSLVEKPTCIHPNVIADPYLK
eukprot:gene4295-4715_t